MMTAFIGKSLHVKERKPQRRQLSISAENGAMRMNESFYSRGSFHTDVFLKERVMNPNTLNELCVCVCVCVCV